MNGPYEFLWMVLWRVLQTPIRTYRLTCIRNSHRERAADIAALARNEVWLHRQDLEALQRIERQAAEANVVMPTARDALVELTRQRMEALPKHRGSHVSISELRSQHG